MNNAGMPPGWVYPAYPAVYAYPMPMGMAPYPYPMHPHAFQPPPMNLPPPLIIGIDVECVATGKTHNDRSVAQFALVVRVDTHEHQLSQALLTGRKRAHRPQRVRQARGGCDQLPHAHLWVRIW